MSMLEFGINLVDQHIIYSIILPTLLVNALTTQFYTRR